MWAWPRRGQQADRDQPRLLRQRRPPRGGRPATAAGRLGRRERRSRCCRCLDLGWKTLGPEGVKRLRHVYVSHQTQRASAPGERHSRVEYQVNIGTECSHRLHARAGQLPTVHAVHAHRLKVGQAGLRDPHRGQADPARPTSPACTTWGSMSGRRTGQAVSTHSSLPAAPGPEQQDAPLTEDERKLLVRLLSDPTYFPIEFRTWIRTTGGVGHPPSRRRPSSAGNAPKVNLPAGVILPFARVRRSRPTCLPCDGREAARGRVRASLPGHRRAWGPGNGTHLQAPRPP